MNKNKTSYNLPEAKFILGFWYSVPWSLEWGAWEQWRTETKQKHPIQYFLREDVVGWFRYRKFCLRERYYAIRNWFFPRHQEIRKAIPNNWQDISSLIIDVNFAMILSFKKEADASIVVWDDNENHKNFKNWLDSAAQYITEERPRLQKEQEDSYPPCPRPDYMKDWTYEQLYGRVNELEKIISDKDTNILKQMIDYREYMWT